jgi:uncharacterized membrane protein
MNAPAAAAFPARRPWLVTAIVACAALGAAYFVHRDAFSYYPIEYERFTDYYWDRRYWLLGHIAAGMLALFVGLLQVWLGLRGRTGVLHRIMGRVYVIAVLVAASVSLYLNYTIPPPRGIYGSGLLGLAGAWLVTTFMGYRAIRAGERARHRLWMLRSYLVTFGFVILRTVEAGLMRGGMSEDAAVGLAAWLCWTVPLLVFEFIRWRRGRAAPLATAAGAR